MPIEVVEMGDDKFIKLYPKCGHPELQYFMSDDKKNIEIDCLKCPEKCVHVIATLSTDELRSIAHTFIEPSKFSSKGSG